MHSEWRDRFQLCNWPVDSTRHAVPYVVEGLQLRFGLDEWKEHTELSAVHLLKESTEHVVVIQKVLTLLTLMCFKGLLEFLEQEVQLLHNHGSGAWWLYAGDPEDDLEPFFDVELHV